ncbi:putative cytochrome b561/ferric reductase transmembrane [Helianthus annuus]|uniref:Cytochrome b561/ferric reductase transmembrane n=1 Tax=Helianthus annuus TaxID=4232 RepID=A0A251TFJ1_HELAN|nr:cytochrome b561 domain-containing protein At2g30890 [Helianthus annuus]KAF5784944.1 putative cytochrome b561/ferric reductase transmembrane [Helianthus annuus]KAJ0512571.1 putative cytochrome b561/ferric reductase transmembrane [Helianthus annuus]KAJ0520135.1 putative cytochrome b561/ferric reductase transmembrane [Helianthus annuus]KAJ0528697.1 putative cytochrome b561/ferric reductase transmembrane [Helianthus annuus]KAJ0695609.1 putative cytochrome b561/ferric reductase transmembrane [He
MEYFIKATNFIIILLVLLLPYVVTSSQEHKEKDSKMLNDRRLSSQIVIHAFLLWASMGFLIPIGILTIRLSNREVQGRRLRIMFFIHAVTQILSVILVAAGAVLSVKNFSNTFNNMHRRLGVVLYGLVLLQAISGLLRPSRDGKNRSTWFFTHWMLGTTVSLLGIINVYTGLHAYQKRSSRSITPWVIFFTAEIVCIGLLYLFQDKWAYIQKQGMIRGSDQPTITIQPTDNREVLAKQNKDSC